MFNKNIFHVGLRAGKGKQIHLFASACGLHKESVERASSNELSDMFGALKFDLVRDLFVSLVVFHNNAACLSV